MTSSNTKLNILLNNTNKALVQVLLDATKDDLKLITKDTKDLRSIMDKVIKQTKDGDSSSNKAMLDLVKKNPTLNNLGNTSTTIKELINTIKSDKNPLPIEKVLKNILVDIKDIKTTDIKPKLDNSGVFLESKIKNITNPQVELKTNLTNLKEVLVQSSKPDVKEILKKVENLLKEPVIKSAKNDDLVKDIKQKPLILEQVSKEVKSLVDKLQKTIQNTDVIYTPKTKEILAKLDFATTPTQTKLVSNEQVQKQDNSVQVLKDAPKDIPKEIQKDAPKDIPKEIQKDAPKDIPKEIQKDAPKDITKEILKDAPKDIPKEIQKETPKDIPKDIQKETPKDIPKISTQQALNPTELKQKVTIPLVVQNMQNSKLSKVVENTQIQSNLQTKLVDDSVIKLPIIKENLQALQTVLDKSLTLESKAVLKSVTAVLASLDVSKEPSKELKQDISKLLQDTKQIIQKADPIYSKDIITIFSKLKNLSTQNLLNPQTNVKEMLSNDLKATLLQTTSELQNSSHPNKNDLIKQMDKLMLQIDHYQLISHLSNGTSVYLPITWDQLEGGDLEIKKDNDKFYCDIELKLKEYGDVSLKLTLFEKNQINIHVYSPNQELKELFHEHISILRSGMISSEIIPREIRFHDGTQKKTTLPYQGEGDNFNMGFEVKG